MAAGELSRAARHDPVADAAWTGGRPCRVSPGHPTSWPATIGQRIVIIIGINVILVVSLNLSNGFTGVFSLGHIGFMAIGAYTASVLTLPVHPEGGESPRPSRVASGAWPCPSCRRRSSGRRAGHGGGLPVVGLSLMRLKGAYVSVATLGFLVIVQVILVNWDQLTRGARTFAGVPRVCYDCGTSGSGRR